ncbi:hypothetical protein Tco_0864641 [Tanacetum coccineum]
MHRGIAWDKVENPDPQSTPQVLPSFEEGPATCLEEVKETLGIPIEVEPLNETPLEDLGLNTCNHDIPLSSKEIPSIDEPEPQPQPLPNFLSLDVSLGEERGPEPPIKPHSLDSFRMKEVDRLTINTPPSPHVASSHPKDMYCYYRPCIDDPKKHYGFKLGLLGKSASLGKELSLFDRPNEVERGRILEAHRLEPILQQQISQRMAPSHHDGNFSSKTKTKLSQSMETASRFARDAVSSSIVTTSEFPDGVMSQLKKIPKFLNRKAHLLEDKQIPGVGVFDEKTFDELHVTWAHLEKKQTRLQTNTKTLEDLCSQNLGDGVTSHTRRRHNSSSDDVTYFKTASARTDSNIDLEDLMVLLSCADVH